MNKYMKIIIPTAIIAVIVAAAIAFSGNKKEEITETKELTNRMLTQEDGKNETYYQGQDTEAVYVNIGRDTYNLTDCVVKWEFGLPIINLNKAAEKMELELTEKYDKELKVSSYEIYAPDEIIDVEERTPIFILGNNDTYVKYKVTSGLIETGESKVASASQIASTYHVDKTEEGDYLISVNMLPYVDTDNNVYPSATSSVTYEDNTIIFNLNR